VIFLIYNDHATAFSLHGSSAGLINNGGGQHFSRQLIDGAKGLAQMPNIEYVREAASEGIELVM
jgi:hypothetical protein